MERRDAAESVEGDKTSREEPDRSGLLVSGEKEISGTKQTPLIGPVVTDSSVVLVALRLLRRAWAVADDNVEAQAKNARR